MGENESSGWFCGGWLCGGCLLAGVFGSGERIGCWMDEKIEIGFYCIYCGQKKVEKN